MRLPTVSLLGLSRSCGSVSQAGNSMISACGITEPSDSRSASDSRPVDTIASSACAVPRLASRPAMSGARSPSTSENSALRVACESASSNVWARESAVINPSSITG
jgi:hypothetical protein